jgi:hypothetical protein
MIKGSWSPNVVAVVFEAEEGEEKKGIEIKNKMMTILNHTKNLIATIIARDEETLMRENLMKENLMKKDNLKESHKIVIKVWIQQDGESIMIRKKKNQNKMIIEIIVHIKENLMKEKEIQTKMHSRNGNAMMIQK